MVSVSHWYKQVVNHIVILQVKSYSNEITYQQVDDIPNWIYMSRIILTQIWFYNKSGIQKRNGTGILRI